MNLSLAAAPYRTIRDRIREQERDDHLVRWRKRREIGKDDKSYQRRQQRQPDRHRAKDAHPVALRRRAGERGIGGCGLVDAHMSLSRNGCGATTRCTIAPKKALDWPFYGLMLLYNNVAKLRQKLDRPDHALPQSMKIRDGSALGRITTRASVREPRGF